MIVNMYCLWWFETPHYAVGLRQTPHSSKLKAFITPLRPRFSFAFPMLREKRYSGRRTPVNTIKAFLPLLRKAYGWPFYSCPLLSFPPAWRAFFVSFRGFNLWMLFSSSFPSLIPQHSRIPSSLFISPPFPFLPYPKVHVPPLPFHPLRIHGSRSHFLVSFSLLPIITVSLFLVYHLNCPSSFFLVVAIVLIHVKQHIWWNKYPSLHVTW